LSGERRFEAREQRVVQRRGNRERGQRAGQLVAVAGILQEPRLEHRLGQLIDEKRHAVSLGYNLRRGAVAEASASTRAVELMTSLPLPPVSVAPLRGAVRRATEVLSSNRIDTAASNAGTGHYSLTKLNVPRSNSPQKATPAAVLLSLATWPM
jgi:hypothetical protein